MQLMLVLANSLLIAEPAKAAAHNAHTAHTVLYFKNENNKKLGVLVKPQLQTQAEAEAGVPEPQPHHNSWFAAEIPEHTTVKVEIPEEELDSQGSFQVTGETTAITKTGTCYNLKRGHSYVLRFTNDTIGTSCVSEQVTGEPKEMEGKSFTTIRVARAHHTNFSNPTPDRPSQASPRLP